MGKEGGEDRKREERREKKREEEKRGERSARKKKRKTKCREQNVDTVIGQIGADGAIFINRYAHFVKKPRCGRSRCGGKM